jgi:hypothetical protein
MMDVQLFRRTTILTPPPVSFEYLVAQKPIFLKVQLQSRLLAAKLLHVFFEVQPMVETVTKQ